MTTLSVTSNAIYSIEMDVPTWCLIDEDDMGRSISEEMEATFMANIPENTRVRTVRVTTIVVPTIHR